MYYFVYYINTIALYWKGKPISLTNKNKEIDNSPIKIAQWVNAEGPKWKNALNHDYKNNYGRNFQCTIFSFIDFVFTDWRNLSGNGQMGLWQIFQSPIFALSGKKCCYKGHLIHSFRFFFSYTGFISLLRKFVRHCL